MGHLQGGNTDVYERLLEGVTESWDQMATICAFPNEGEGIAVLDVGAGAGEPSCRLAKAYPKAEVTTTDLESDMVEKAKTRSARLGVRLNFAVCSAEDLSPFADASFDAVTANFVLMFLPNRHKFLQEAKRVLKPDGRLILTVWKDSPLAVMCDQAALKVLGLPLPDYQSINEARHALGLQNAGSVERLVEESGLRVTASEDCKLTMVWEGDETIIRENLLFCGRRGMQDVPVEARAETEEALLRCLAEEAEQLGVKNPDGSFQFASAYQILVITK